MAKLILTDGNGTQVVFPLLEPEVLIGRMDSADLVLEDMAVSRIHAKIVWDAGSNVLIDLESKTGTFVNGMPVHKHELNDGDTIEIGGSRMQYRE